MGLRAWSASYGLLVAAGLALALDSQANETLDSDQRELFPGLGGTDPTTGLPRGLVGTGDREFLVLEVENIAGNDPFDEQQPFLNFNGERLGSVQELLAAIAGIDNIDDGDDDGGDVGDNVCDPALVTSTPFPVPNGFGGFNDFAFASIDIDPVTGECRSLNNSNGNFLLFSYPGFDQNNSIFDLDAEIFLFDLIEITAPFGQGFTLITPPDDPRGFFGFFDLGRQVFEVRQDSTGNVFQIEVDIQQVAGAAGAIDVIDFSGIATQAQGIIATPVFTLNVISFEVP